MYKLKVYFMSFLIKLMKQGKSIEPNSVYLKNWGGRTEYIKIEFESALRKRSHIITAEFLKEIGREVSIQ